MPIRLICVCQRVMTVPEKYAGERVQCPDCGAMLSIPTGDEDKELARWLCECGQRLKARARSAGRAVKCPRCGKAATMPFGEKDASFVHRALVLEDDVESEPAPAPKGQSDSVPDFDTDGPVEFADDDEEPEVIELAPQQDERSGAEGGLAPSGGGPPAIPVGDAEDVIPIEGEEAGAGGEEIDLAEFLDDDAPDEEILLAIDDAGADEAMSIPLRPGVPRTKPSARARPSPPVQSIAAGPAAPEEDDYEEDDEGIHARHLSKYFNVAGGVDAATSGVQQVMNGHWLYIPYALLSVSLSHVFVLLRQQAGGQTGATIALMLLPGLFSLFLISGFLGCVKDGVFERAMGIERLFYNGGKYFLRFAGTCLLMVPLGVGIVVGGIVLTAVVVALNKLMLIAVIILALPVGLVLFVIFLVPPVIAVLEQTNPVYAVGRGAVFVAKHAWHLISMSIVSALIGGGAVMVVYFFYWIGGWLLRQFLGGWFTMAVRPLMWSLVGAAILGQLVSSIMVLRLSFIEERALQDVRRKLRGPAAVPWRLYVAIGVLAAAMIGLSYPAGRALRLFRPKAKTYTPSKDDDMRPPPRLQRRGAPGGGQRMPPIRPDEGAE